MAKLTGSIVFAFQIRQEAPDKFAFRENTFFGYKVRGAYVNRKSLKLTRGEQ